MEKIDRKKMHQFLENNGISPSGYVYELPLHKQPVLSEHNKLTLSKTELLCSSHICLPVFYTMHDDQVRFVVKTLKECISSEK